MNYDVINNMFQRTTSDHLDEIYNSTDRNRICLMVDTIRQELIIRKLELKRSCTYYWEDEQGNKYDNFWCHGSTTAKMVVGECIIHSTYDEYWRNLRKLHTRY